jgi:GxxExxY protein
LNEGVVRSSAPEARIVQTEIPVMATVEELASVVVNAAYHIHREVGPGLFESVYEQLLATELRRHDLLVECQIEVPLEIRGIRFKKSFRIDILVEQKLIVEIKSIPHLAAAHQKQVLTYLRLLQLPLGLLINFGAATFRQGICRIVNNHVDFRNSPLRIHHQSDIPHPGPGGINP